MYQRYLEKIDMTYPIGTFLHSLLHDVTSSKEIDMTYLGMQILIEGVALAAFSLGGAMFGNPLIAQITELVRRDEARHVAFGVLSLQGFYDDMDPIDLRVREEFLIESCAAIRDRFVPLDVFDRMGFDVAQAEKEFTTSPDAMLFRNLIFSKGRAQPAQAGAADPEGPRGIRDTRHPPVRQLRGLCNGGGRARPGRFDGRFRRG